MSYLLNTKIFLLLLFLSLTSALFSQKEELAFDYDRNSLSYLLLHYKNDPLPRDFEALFIPEANDKFFLNATTSNHQWRTNLERPVPKTNTNEK